MKTTLPSNQSFGWTFSGALTIAAFFYPWTLAPAIAIGLVTIVRERWLTPFNRAWMRLGELMGRVVSPLVLGLIFFGVFTPTGLLMRLVGRDALNRKWDSLQTTYWIPRDPPGPSETSFNNMF